MTVFNEWITLLGYIFGGGARIQHAAPINTNYQRYFNQITKPSNSLGSQSGRQSASQWFTGLRVYEFMGLRVCGFAGLLSQHTFAGLQV